MPGRSVSTCVQSCAARAVWKAVGNRQTPLTVVYIKRPRVSAALWLPRGSEARLRLAGRGEDLYTMPVTEWCRGSSVQTSMSWWWGGRAAVQKLFFPGRGSQRLRLRRQGVRAGRTFPLHPPNTHMCMHGRADPDRARHRRPAPHGTHTTNTHTQKGSGTAP